MDLFSVLKQLSPADKISKAKITLYKDSPFFAYITEHMSFIEDTKGVLPFKTMGINETGQCLFSAEFVNSINASELVGVLAHESHHLGMLHVKRGKGKDIMVNGMSLWNIVTDISTNNLLLKNNFSLPENSWRPVNDEVTVFEKKITNISDKSAEDIYEELKVELKEMIRDGKATSKPDSGKHGSGDGVNVPDKKLPQGFDEHMEGGAGEQDGDKEGKGSGAKPEAGEGKQPAKDWTKIAAEAYTYAKLIGKEPGGMGRAFEHLRKHKINWRALLRRTVANKIPYDLTYSRPNKKYMAHDIFLPTTIGESVKVIASFDTSGSMSEKELSESLSEVIGIARSFSQVDVHVLSHDVDVHDDVKISDATVDKIKKIQVHGGGGTSHIPLYEYIRKKRMRRETKLLISFTDGYSEFPERKPDVDTIFVLTGMHVPPEQMPKWAVTVCLD